MAVIHACCPCTFGSLHQSAAHIRYSCSSLGPLHFKGLASCVCRHCLTCKARHRQAEVLAVLPRQLLALCLHKGLAARIIAQQAAAAADCFYGLIESLKRDSCQALCATVPVCAVAGLPVMGSAAECQQDQVECCLSSPAMLSCQLVLPACSSAACVKELTIQQLGQEAVPAILSTCHRCTGASSGELGPTVLKFSRHVTS